MLSIEVAKPVLVQWNSIDHQHQQQFEVLYTFIPNKFYDYLLNFEPSNLVFSKTFDNTAVGDIIMRFTDQNGKVLEIEDKVSLTLLINKQKLHVILQNQKQENTSKDMDLYHS